MYTQILFKEQYFVWFTHSLYTHSQTYAAYFKQVIDDLAIASRYIGNCGFSIRCEAALVISQSHRRDRLQTDTRPTIN